MFETAKREQDGRRQQWRQPAVAACGGSWRRQLAAVRFDAKFRVARRSFDFVQTL
jgi:hypothetical protein